MHEDLVYFRPERGQWGPAHGGIEQFLDEWPSYSAIFMDISGTILPHGWRNEPYKVLSDYLELREVPMFLSYNKEQGIDVILQTDSLFRLNTYDEMQELLDNTVLGDYIQNGVDGSTGGFLYRTAPELYENDPAAPKSLKDYGLICALHYPSSPACLVIGDPVEWYSCREAGVPFLQVPTFLPPMMEQEPSFTYGGLIDCGRTRKRLPRENDDAELVA